MRLRFCHAAFAATLLLQPNLVPTLLADLSSFFLTFDTSWRSRETVRPHGRRILCCILMVFALLAWGSTLPCKENTTRCKPFHGTIWPPHTVCLNLGFRKNSRLVGIARTVRSVNYSRRSSQAPTASTQLGVC